MLPTGLCAQLACIWEATARKPGNVHRFCDFDDVGYLDFLLSAAAVGPVFDRASQQRIGKTILEAVTATRRVVTSNTNLGIVLLLTPLAAVSPSEDLQAGLARVLDALNDEDARAVYQAIRLADPGGMGTVPDQDIHQEPSGTLREIMALAADRDLIARQYANGFQEIFGDGVPALRTGLEKTKCLERAILYCHLHMMATYPDSLIGRKRGLVEAQEAGRQAQQVLAQGWPHDQASQSALAKLDAWLRAEGHSRNPGTTADLVTACLFVLLREGTIGSPPQYPWSAGADHA